jgi:hypothetical protein
MRILLSNLLMILLPFTAVAQSQLPACTAGTIKHNCYGTYTASNGGVYVGEFKDGKRHGQGTHNYGGGGKYEGEFSDDKRNGQGTQNYSNGNKYVGEFKYDKRHGIGTFYHLADNQYKGDKFVGSYKDDKPNGQGTYIRISGEIHEGEYKDDKLNGQGSLTFANGNKYIGEFRDGKRNGQGTLTYANGDKYVGDWKDGWGSGQGTKTFINGDTYVGEFKDGKRNGHGTLTYVKGSRYVGEFKDGDPNGQGIEYAYSGSINRQGIWVNGNLVQSLALDAQRFPLSAAVMAAASNSSNIDSGKVERDRLLAELEASRKKQQELEDRLKTAITKPQNFSLISERRVALVIGNGRYKNAPLSNPVNDAEDMSATLKGLGFQVTTMQDANLRKLREATRVFESSVASADVALIFYAGHAVEAKGRNFLIPVDADVAREYELEDQAYDAQQWLAMLGDTKGKNTQRVNIVILDACRDNPVSRQWRSVGSGLGRMDAPSGTLLVYSTSPGKVASDGPKGQRNSPFTKSLLRSMQTPNVPVEQVLKDVRRQVLAETKGEQVPWENSSLIGDFVFKRQQ